MWFSAIKLALNAGTHIFKKRQETKMAMADAQHMHALRWPEVRSLPGQTFRGSTKRL